MILKFLLLLVFISFLGEIQPVSAAIKTDSEFGEVLAYAMTAENYAVDLGAMMKQAENGPEEHSFWRGFFLPGINVLHIVFLVLILALYLRNRALWKQLMRTRGKLRNLHVKLNRRVDQLTYEQRELSKKAKPTAK